MPTTLEKVLQKVRVNLDKERNPDMSRKFAKTISLNIFTDEAIGSRVGVVIGETEEDEFGNSDEITIVIQEEEITDKLADERVAAALTAFDLRTGV